MAFNKEEIKQLKDLLKETEHRINSNTDIKIQEKIDEFAMMVKNSFDKTSEDINELKKRIQVIEIGQEEIKLRLDNVPYRFEMKVLERKVKALEESI